MSGVELYQEFEYRMFAMLKKLGKDTVTWDSTFNTGNGPIGQLEFPLRSGPNLHRCWGRRHEAAAQRGCARLPGRCARS